MKEYSKSPEVRYRRKGMRRLYIYLSTKNIKGKQQFSIEH